jgi:hypothetical protein
LVVLLVAVGGAAAELSQASKANRSAARRDAAKQLGALSLPPGAGALQSQRARVILEHASFDCRGGAFGGYTPYLNVIRDRRYWEVTQDPASVRSWIRGHVPPRSSLVDSGSTTTRSGGTVWYLTFAFGPYQGRVGQRCLDVVIKRRSSGDGTAVGAVSQATWRLTRPNWDYVPSRARLITVTHRAERRSRRTVLRDPHRVARIVKGLNRARVFQPEILHCPRGRPESWKVVFRGRRAGPVLAEATLGENGCASLRLNVKGRRGPQLVITQELWNALQDIPTQHSQHR